MELESERVAQKNISMYLLVSDKAASDIGMIDEQ